MQRVDQDDLPFAPPPGFARVLSRILSLEGRACSTRTLADAPGGAARSRMQEPTTRVSHLADRLAEPPRALEVAGPESGASWAIPERVGRYAVRGVLGRGGMGVVLEAYDEHLDRTLAIKLLHRHLVDRYATRLLREARALARLSHPNVVQVYEVGTTQGQAFVAMERVPGQTLRAWQAEPRSWRECVEVYGQAGQGLAAAHAKGLVHRDFKPSNCILDEEGRVRVLDFGLVRDLDAHALGMDPGQSSCGTRWDGAGAPGLVTTAGTILGTLAYMSPEQLRAEPADARADQFSFCVALYEALYGARPFEGRTVEARAWAIEQGRVRPRPEHDAVPSRLHEAVLRGLARRPEDRWPTMSALLDELRRVEPSRTGWTAQLMAALAVALGVGTSSYAAVDGVHSVDAEDQARLGVHSRDRMAPH